MQRELNFVELLLYSDVARPAHVCSVDIRPKRVASRISHNLPHHANDFMPYRQPLSGRVPSPANRAARTQGIAYNVFLHKRKRLAAVLRLVSS